MVKGLQYDFDKTILTRRFMLCER